MINRFILAALLLGNPGDVKTLELSQGKVVTTVVPPTISVTGAENPIAVGELVDLKIALDNSSLPAGYQDIQYKWTVLGLPKEKVKVLSPKGDEIVFGTGPVSRQFTVMVSVGGQKVSRDPSGTTITSSEMALADPILVTVDVVGPDPVEVKSVVEIPAGKYGLAQFAYDKVNDLKGITAPEKALAARAMSRAFSSVVAKIDGTPSYNNLQTMLSDVKSVGDVELSKTGIAPGKLIPLQIYIQDAILEIHTNKGFQTVEDLRTAFSEIGVGLGSFQVAQNSPVLRTQKKGLHP